ncbi:TadE/TadG family type IV pilus assembly protein [Jannaschia sp. CCS1]|uniref:TadE/TadG family type IV pilus assembly protein n=1 Tax=Jannaschia sp. (strain CCS1) TaxID=290400 RepID=UPI00030684DB|nr:TadE/TadG family type IV pilus assembly protein [Jannaschia sp. CCS1]
MFGLFQKMQTSAGAIAARLAPRQFMRREEGTITAFATMLFILMVGASGIAIDVMRYETQRSQLQYTLDRAVLAAASLTQPYDPEGVVRDYFAIAGIDGYRLDVRVEEGLNFRRVHAYAELEVRSIFMQMFGVRAMTSPAIGAAEERVRRIEVSMVLDISGSMGENNRMTNMRPAAREFVTEVLSANENVNNELLVSVSIVPYNGRVNGGDLIESVFTYDDLHSESNCTRFAEADFTSTAIDPAVPLQRIAHWDRGNEEEDESFQWAHCQTDQYGAILPWQHTEAALHAHIDSLNTGGWTAIDLGMNWAVGLLDPAAAPALTGLIASGHVHPEFSDRPAPYRDGDRATTIDDETIKVVVLMTDGDNTRQYDLRDIYDSAGRYVGFREGYAPIFRNTSTGQYSIWWEDQGAFWIPTGNTRDPGGSWQAQPDGGWSRYGMTALEFTEDRANAFDPAEAGNGEVLLWADLFSDHTAGYIAAEWFHAPADESEQWDFYNQLAENPSHNYIGWDSDGVRPDGVVGQSQADTNLMAICDVANAAGIIVYAIGFEAPDRGQRVMEHCASVDANYFDVEGREISEAFASIARSINQLRLIQ